MSRALRLLLALSLAMNLGVLGAAAYHWRTRLPHDATLSERSRASENTLRQELLLSDEQAREFDALQADLQTQLDGARVEMRGLREAFLRLLSSPGADHVALDQHLAAMDQVQSRIQRTVANNLLAKKKRLSPAQQATFLDLLKRSFEREDHHATGAVVPSPVSPMEQQGGR